MEQKPISRARIKQLLKENPRVKTVSKPAIDWIIAVAECAAKSLATHGGLTPSGQLRAPRMDAGLMVRHLTKAPDEIAGVTLIQEDPTELRRTQARAQMQSDTAWSPYNDWQTERRSGRTKLSFEEWEKQRK